MDTGLSAVQKKVDGCLFFKIGSNKMQGHCKGIACVGRALLGLFFVAMGALNFAEPDVGLSVLVAHGFAHPDMIFNIGIIIEIILGILIVIGVFHRVAAWILVVFTVIVAVSMHDFWHQTGPAKVLNAIQFLSDFGIVGGLLLIASCKKHCESKTE